RPADVPGNEGAIKEWEQRSYISKLGARLGKTPRQIHYRHVPQYMKKFADHVDRFMVNLQPQQPFWRRNWSVKLDDRLCLNPATFSFPDGITPDMWDTGFLRIEQQNLIKLPRSGAVVFSIKTYLWPLNDVLANPDTNAALRAAHENMVANEPLMAQYRDWSLPTFGQHLRNIDKGAPKITVK
ncbi:MAG: heme-dependent oxidative N-demethylase subunit alpha family protein, partial [Bdellovibrionales bacterium]